MKYTPYIPNKYQKAVHSSRKRFRVVVWHRRAGKSTLAINEVLKHAKVNPGRYWIVMPSYRQAKTVMWPLLKQYTPQDWIVKANESSLEVWLKNGTEIALKGAENKDSLRGVGLKGVVLDEFAFMSRPVWSEIIRPTLTDHKGWALFIGTPFGKNHFYELYNYGQDQEGHPDWQSWQLSALTSGLVAEREVEQVRKETTQAIFESEWEAKFIEGAGQVFRNVRKNATSAWELPDPLKIYRIGVDLARLTDYTVISVVDRHTFQQVHLERFGELDWSVQKDRIKAICYQYNSAETVIDVTGVGDPVVEDLLKEEIPIIEFKYTGDKKKILIENLARMFDRNRLKILPDETQIRECEAFTYTMSPDTGRYRYNAPEGMHDDCVNALALSVWDIQEPLPIPQKEYREVDTYFENPYG